MPTEDAEAGEALRAEVETAFDISSTAEAAKKLLLRGPGLADVVMNEAARGAR